MKQIKISQHVDEWIAEEELPSMPWLKEKKPAFKCLFDEDEQFTGEKLEMENQAYWEFISWVMSREHQVLLSIPKPELENDFYLPVESDDSNSFAFSSADYRRLYGREFNMDAWQTRKLYERVKDLAQTYSVIVTQPEIGRRNILRRFLELVSDVRKGAVKFRCFNIWNEYAYEPGQGWGRV